LNTVDYRLSDPFLDPVGMEESGYTEQTIRLPDTYWCYPASVAAPPVNDLPLTHKGHVTFGCLNNFCKMSEACISAWTKVLAAVPRAELLLHSRPGSHRAQMLKQFEQNDVDPARVRFADKMPMADYFRLYQRIDIALDTFPYNGGTTTCDALWMGVPVVSLAGATAVGRGGLSILSNLGLSELVARSMQEYVHLAADLAGDVPRLSLLRASLRRRMSESPLMDGPRFARNVEDAFHHMWRLWCIK
jgi:protein O-GlcNAc transferase